MGTDSEKQKKLLIFIMCCLIVMCISCFAFYKYNIYKEAYNKIHLTFKETKEKYEINTQLDAISFIKNTNAYNIVYPKIDTSKIGEHTYIYLAEDKQGNKREFVLILNIVDSIKPIIELTQDTVTVKNNSEYLKNINFKEYIKKAYDPLDGELEVSIDIPKEYKEVGTHIIQYSVTDSNANTTIKKLKLIVKAEEKTENKKNNSSHKTNKENKVNKKNEKNKKTETKPVNEKFMFEDGYDIDSASKLCTGRLYEAKHKGYSGGCYPIKDDNNIYVGMELKID